MVAILIHDKLSINLYPKGHISDGKLYIPKDVWHQWLRENRPKRRRYAGFLGRR